MGLLRNPPRLQQPKAERPLKPVALWRLACMQDAAIEIAWCYLQHARYEAAVTALEVGRGEYFGPISSRMRVERTLADWDRDGGPVDLPWPAIIAPANAGRTSIGDLARHVIGGRLERHQLFREAAELYLGMTSREASLRHFSRLTRDLSTAGALDRLAEVLLVATRGSDDRVAAEMALVLANVHRSQGDLVAAANACRTGIQRGPGATRERAVGQFLQLLEVDAAHPTAELVFRAAVETDDDRLLRLGTSRLQELVASRGGDYGPYDARTDRQFQVTGCCHTPARSC